MGTEIPLWIGGLQKWVTGVTKHTTCGDVVGAVLSANDHHHHRNDHRRHRDPSKYVIVERWHKVEKPLDPRSRLLKVWNTWGLEQCNVRFLLKRAHHGHTSTPRDVKAHKRKQSTRSTKTWHPRKLRSESEDEIGSVGRCWEDEDQFPATEEQLKNLIASQNDAISSQLKRLKEKDEQIEVIENEIHTQRMHQIGANYVLDTYLTADVAEADTKAKGTVEDTTDGTKKVSRKDSKRSSDPRKDSKKVSRVDSKREPFGGDSKRESTSGDSKRDSTVGDSKRVISGESKKESLSGNLKKESTCGDLKKESTCGDLKKESTCGDSKKLPTASDSNRVTTGSDSKRTPTDVNSTKVSDGDSSPIVTSVSSVDCMDLACNATKVISTDTTNKVSSAEAPEDVTPSSCDIFDHCIDLYEKILRVCDQIHQEESTIKELTRKIQQGVRIKDSDANCRLLEDDDPELNYAGPERLEEILQRTKHDIERLLRINQTQQLTIQQNEKTLVDCTKIIQDKHYYLQHLKSDLERLDKDNAKLQEEFGAIQVIPVDRNTSCDAPENGDSNSDTGLSSLHSSSDDGTNILDTLV